MRVYSGRVGGGFLPVVAWVFLFETVYTRNPTPKFACFWVEKD